MNLLNSQEAFESLLAAADDPLARVRIAKRMARAGFIDRAHAIAAQAYVQTEDPEVRTVSRSLIAGMVPRWHFGLVADETRNAAYEAAIKRAVFPGCRVFEIGTGTGILAMMAARAGAAEVVSCEANAAVATLARQIVQLNGYADRVRIVNKHSDDLVLGEDLGGPADVFVSEIISSNLFGEHAVPAIRGARRLLKEGARVIPSHVSTRIALAQAPAPLAMGRVSGFDLAPFNLVQSTWLTYGVGRSDIHLRSEPADLFTVDFSGDLAARDGRASVDFTSLGGTVNGVIQWLYIRMDEQGEYENRPEAGTLSCWGVIFRPLGQAVETSAGDTFRVTGCHDTLAMDLWCEPIASISDA